MRVRIEHWKNGQTREVVRDEKGHFVSHWAYEEPEKPTVEIITPEYKIEEIERPEIWRYTVGTNFSDRNQPVSFSGYFFKHGEFDYLEKKKCFLLFFDICFEILYPSKNYGYRDYWGASPREGHQSILDYADNFFYIIEFHRNEVLRAMKQGFWQ